MATLARACAPFSRGGVPRESFTAAIALCRDDCFGACECHDCCCCWYALGEDDRFAARSSSPGSATRYCGGNAETAGTTTCRTRRRILRHRRQTQLAGMYPVTCGRARRFGRFARVGVCNPTRRVLMLVASVGSVFGAIVVFAILGLVAVAKLGTFARTNCIHCGHDSGVTGARAPVCPACGRNRTVLNTRKARKR